MSASLASITMSRSLAAAGVAALIPGRLMSRPRPANSCPALHCPSACTTTYALAPMHDVFYNHSFIHTHTYNRTEQIW